MIKYPTTNTHLPFTEYISICKNIIKKHRIDLNNYHVDAQTIIDANSPFELTPKQPIYCNNKYKYGVLLLHGLFDCPFSFQDIAGRLQTNGVVCRSLLLPGHGTSPRDLLTVSYQDWLETLHYGIASFKDEVEHLFLAGYSTGGTLAVYQALQNQNIAGIILLAPALKIKSPMDILLNWHFLKKYVSNHREWLWFEDETDYTRYRSILFNAVNQLVQLINLVKTLRKTNKLSCPVMLVTTNEDEIISSAETLRFFSQSAHPKSKLIFYTSQEKRQTDERIISRLSRQEGSSIRNYSHLALPFSPDNKHYGKHGDYFHAAHPEAPQYMFGAYNRLQIQLFDLLYSLGLNSVKRRELTYNPDFDFMTDEIIKFILES